MNWDKELWKRTAMTHEDLSSEWATRLQFLNMKDGEAITASTSITINGNVLQIADAVSSILSPVAIRGQTSSDVFVFGELNGERVMVYVGYSDRNSYSGEEWAEDSDDDDNEPSEIFANQVRSFDIRTTGSREIVRLVSDKLDETFKRQKFSQIRWWYRANHGPQMRTIFIPPVTTKLLPEFYPDIADGPNTLLSGYLSSPASILLLAGPPGTGKTTLLRHLVADNKMAAHVVYDETLMNDDSVFQAFLFGKDADIMIIEDADTILASREAEKNKLMARFLNVSDGLIKLPNKKLVFTTNLSDFARIDQALMRPGRCYGVLHTRPLDLAEAQAAAKAAKLPIPLEKRQYTLAELFNTRTQQTPVRKIGFAE